ncbi:MAG: agmatine deiminase [Parachlamydiales bacterium]|nr:agmatine deiminase [Parachlamydiales bacterium]
MEPLYQMPAEWEKHRATWIAWPHQESDFPGKLAAVQWVYPEIVRVLAESEFVEILVSPKTAKKIESLLDANGIPHDRYRLHEVATNRSWLRDSGPTFVRHKQTLALMGWSFNAWAKYPQFHHDANLPDIFSTLTRLPLISPMRGNERIVLEGGGIEVDGQGTLLVTEEWLLSSEQIRNPGMTREQYEEIFARYLGIRRTIWLGRGCVGDDTHGHIDDIARFAAPGIVLLAYEENSSDENHAASRENLECLLAATDAHGQTLHVIKLPYPRPIYFQGQRLPASYANFYIANNAVLVPTFNDQRDCEALSILAKAFPERRIIGIHALDLVWGLGTLHCLTQQEISLESGPK